MPLKNLQHLATRAHAHISHTSDAVLKYYNSFKSKSKSNNRFVHWAVSEAAQG